MEQITKLIAQTALALQFFSRLPVPQPDVNLNDKRPNLNEAIAAFPLAGLAIALPSALVFLLASQVLPPLLCATIAIALSTFITGALHEDGLADCADGLGGAVEKSRVLEIMRDSTIGTYGAAALFFSFALRIFALASLSPTTGALALLLTHMSARAAMVIAIATASYARESGLGEAVSGGAKPKDIRLCFLIMAGFAIIIAITTGTLAILLAPMLGFFSAWVFLQILKSRLGGYTGDGLGAMEQIAEIVTLIILAGIWT